MSERTFAHLQFERPALVLRLAGLIVGGVMLPGALSYVLEWMGVCNGVQRRDAAWMVVHARRRLVVAGEATGLGTMRGVPARLGPGGDAGRETGVAHAEDGAMNDRAWFPLSVRCVGLIIAGLGMPRLLDQIVRTGEWLHGVSNTGWTWFGMFATCGYLVAAGSQVALGVYLALGGREIVAWILADDAARCPACQHDLRGLEGAACPSCGRATDQRGSEAPHSGQVPGGESRQS